MIARDNVNPVYEEQLEQYNREEAMRKTAIGQSAVSATDTATLGTIFFLLAKETLKKAFEQLAQYILLPIAAASQVTQAILAWRQAHLSKYEGLSVGRAVVETIAAAGITAAVVGTFVAATMFAVVGPALFTAMFGMKTLFNAGTAIFHGIKAARENDPEKKQEHASKAKEALLGTVVGVVATVAVAAVMIFGKTALAVLGIAAGVIGAVFGVGKAIQLANKRSDLPTAAPYIRAPQHDRELGDEQRNELASSAHMRRSLEAQRPPQPSFSPATPEKEDAEKVVDDKAETTAKKDEQLEVALDRNDEVVTPQVVNSTTRTTRPGLEDIFSFHNDEHKDLPDPIPFTNDAKASNGLN